MHIQQVKTLYHRHRKRAPTLSEGPMHTSPTTPLPPSTKPSPSEGKSLCKNPVHTYQQPAPLIPKSHTAHPPPLPLPTHITSPSFPHPPPPPSPHQSSPSSTTAFSRTHSRLSFPSSFLIDPNVLLLSPLSLSSLLSPLSLSSLLSFPSLYFFSRPPPPPPSPPSQAHLNLPSSPPPESQPPPPTHPPTQKTPTHPSIPLAP